MKHECKHSHINYNRWIDMSWFSIIIIIIIVGAPRWTVSPESKWWCSLFNGFILWMCITAPLSIRTMCTMKIHERLYQYLTYILLFKRYIRFYTIEYQFIPFLFSFSFFCCCSCCLILFMVNAIRHFSLSLSYFHFYFS